MRDAGQGDTHTDSQTRRDRGGEQPGHIGRERYEVGTEPRHAPSLEINGAHREQERFGFGDREMLWY